MRMQTFSGRVTRLAAIALLSAASAGASAHDAALSPDEIVAIRATCERFRQGWLDNDAERVMAEMTADAVIMPHHGVKPRVGAAAIRAFWWPKGSPPAKVTRFEQSLEDIAGHAALAYVRGSNTVEYEWGQPGDVKLFRNVGTTLTLLRKVAPGTWKISVRMWDDPPTETVRTVTNASADGGGR